MSAKDTEVIKARIENLSNKKQLITGAITIETISYVFSQRKINDKFVITIPKDFDTLPVNLARIKYPNENRPAIILSNSNFTVDVFFEINDSESTKIEDRLKQNKMIVKRLHPANVFFKEIVYKVDKTKIGCFDFRSPALDTDIYNFWFVFDLGFNSIWGGFSCPSDLQSKWEPIIHQMVQTIKPIPNNECL